MEGLENEIRKQLENLEQEEEDFDQDVQFEKALKKYNNNDFLALLIEALHFDSEAIGRYCPELRFQKFKIYDYQLGRSVHLLENLIYLASGQLRTSFLCMLTAEDTVKPKELRITKPMHHLKRI